MQPNYFYSSPHYPFNLQTSSVAMKSSWNGDTSYSSTPVSVALYNTTATSSWAHTVPAFMPWVTESGGNNSSTSTTTTTTTTTSNTNVEQVMRFTAPFPPDPCTSQTATSWELFNNLGAGKTNTNIHLKRRNDLEDVGAPRKQCITDEKMAARFQELHITNQYNPPPPSPTSTQSSSENNIHKPTKLKPITTLQELDALFQVDHSESSRKGSLVLAPEIKSLVEPEKLFAKTLLNQVERPTMAVVLWKPPHGSVQDIRTDSLQQSNYVTTISDSENNFVSSSSMVTETNNNCPTTSNIVHRVSLGHSRSSSTSSSTLPVYPLASTNQEESDYIMEV